MGVSKASAEKMMSLSFLLISFFLFCFVCFVCFVFCLFCLCCEL